MTDQVTADPHVLDDPPPFHDKLLDYGERPYWSPDGRRIAFVDKHYGDICEIDVETREVRNLTQRQQDTSRPGRTADRGLVSGRLDTSSVKVT